MTPRIAAPQTPERSAAILNDAVRRVDAAISGAVDLVALRRALETKMAKGRHFLVALMKVCRRRVLDRMAWAARKAKARC